MCLLCRRCAVRPSSSAVLEPDVVSFPPWLVLIIKVVRGGGAENVLYVEKSWWQHSNLSIRLSPESSGMSWSYIPLMPYRESYTPAHWPLIFFSPGLVIQASVFDLWTQVFQQSCWDPSSHKWGTPECTGRPPSAPEYRDVHISGIIPAVPSQLWFL